MRQLENPDAYGLRPLNEEPPLFMRDHIGEYEYVSDSSEGREEEEEDPDCPHYRSQIRQMMRAISGGERTGERGGFRGGYRGGKGRCSYRPDGGEFVRPPFGDRPHPY
jgi:hypothetical protein